MAEQKWTPVKDKLPELSGQYLVTEEFAYIEIPPHGRLIDADAFGRRCIEAIPYGFANEDEIRAYNKILGLLKEATTIIEAEE